MCGCCQYLFTKTTRVSTHFPGENVSNRSEAPAGGANSLVFSGLYFRRQEPKRTLIRVLTATMTDSRRRHNGPVIFGLQFDRYVCHYAGILCGNVLIKFFKLTIFTYLPGILIQTNFTVQIFKVVGHAEGHQWYFNICIL